MKKTAGFVLLAALLSDVGVAHAAAPRDVAEVAVVGSRVHLSDLLPGVRSEAKNVDLGPAPKLHAVRVVEREELVQALRANSVPEPKTLPKSFRLVRKTVRVTASEAESRLRDALGAAMPKGASLKRVALDAPLELPAGELRAMAEIPKPPRRQGSFATRAVVSFAEEGEVVAQVVVPIELGLTAEAGIPDVARGATVMLVYRQGLIEISTPATVTTEADIGESCSVMLRPSGRILRGKLVDKDHVVVSESPS